VISAPEVSVVVPTRNRATSLWRTLEALARQSCDPGGFEAVVVANGCSDDTVATARGIALPYPSRLVELPTPGAARARNAGAAAAHGEVLVFLDDDVEPLPTFVAAHARVHRDRGRVVALGPVLPPPPPRRPSLFAERMGAIDAALSALMAGAGERRDWSCTAGGNLSLSRSLFEATGGFDATLLVYGSEDFELTYRAQKLGARFAFVAEGGGYHHRREHTTLTQYLRNRRSAGRNDVAVAQRHPEIVDRLTLGLVTRPRTAVGRIGRVLAFDYPAAGDAVAHSLQLLSYALAGLRSRRSWNQLIDCLHEYWYFRGVADRLGDRAATTAHLARLRASVAADEHST